MKILNPHSSYYRSEVTTCAVLFSGNLDPCALYAPKDELWKLTEEMLRGFGTQKLVANLGHGIYPDMDPDHVQHFITAVHAISEKINGEK